MDIEKWLNQVRKLDELIDAKISERERLWSIATNVTASVSDGMPYAKGGVSDPVGNTTVKLVAMADEIDRLVDTYVDYKAQVVSVLEKLPANEYGVLHRYYIRYMTLGQIAEDMGYCERQIRRIKKKGLQNLESVLECHVAE